MTPARFPASQKGNQLSHISVGMAGEVSAFHALLDAAAYAESIQVQLEGEDVSSSVYTPSELYVETDGICADGETNGYYVNIEIYPDEQPISEGTLYLHTGDKRWAFDVLGALFREASPDEPVRSEYRTTIGK